MRIVVDSRMIYKSGIGRYIRNLLSELAAIDEELEFDLMGSGEDFKRFLNHEIANGKERFGHINYETSIYSLSEQIAGSIKMRGQKEVDIFHVPHFNAPWFMPAKSVITVHDLIPFIFPQMHHPLRLRVARQVMCHAIQKADRIIVVSDATASDLTAMFPGIAVKEKIRRIYLGVSTWFKPLNSTEVDQFKAQNHLGDYILYVGNRLPHKNLGRLAHAFASLQNDFPGLQLVVVGDRFHQVDELDRVKKEVGSPRIIEWEPVEDKILRALYSGAQALVFPSLYEGFGLPSLEAMACGTPVIVSNTASLLEVVGEAGIYVEPQNVEDIAQGIHRVLSDSLLRARLSEAGINRARCFDWKDTAQQTLDVYREVAAL